MSMIPTHGSALLTADAAVARVRPLRGWSSAHRQALSQVVSAVLADWSAGLGLSPATRAEVCPATGWLVGAWTTDPDAPGLAWSFRGNGQAREGEDPRQGLLTALFDDATPCGGSRLVDEVVETAWRAWWTQLEASLGPAGASRDGLPDFHAWSGTLVVVIPWWNGTLALAVDGFRVEACVRRSGIDRRHPMAGQQPLARVTDVALSLGTAAQVESRAFEVDLGALLSLRPGDVLRTSHPLESPLLVRTAGGLNLGEAFLGSRDGHRAVQLLPMATASPTVQPSHRP